MVDVYIMCYSIFFTVPQCLRYNNKLWYADDAPLVRFPNSFQNTKFHNILKQTLIELSQLFFISLSIDLAYSVGDFFASAIVYLYVVLWKILLFSLFLYVLWNLGIIKSWNQRTFDTIGLVFFDFLRHSVAFSLAILCSLGFIGSVVGKAGRNICNILCYMCDEIYVGQMELISFGWFSLMNGVLVGFYEDWLE